MLRRTLSDSAPTLTRRSLLLRTSAAGVLVAGGLSAAWVGTAQASPPVPATASGGSSSEVRDVSANLWEWNWRSVAKECTDVLGPAGYASVQVAPPQDSLKRTSLGNGSDTVLHPWWEVYQAVDYGLTSRMGTEAEFKAMVTTCRKAGVQVLVDTVINHMTGQGNISYGDVRYSKYTYPGLYRPSDFHSYPRDCPVAPPAGSGRRSAPRSSPT
jgi:alpha-amylase